MLTGCDAKGALERARQKAAEHRASSNNQEQDEATGKSNWEPYANGDASDDLTAIDSLEEDYDNKEPDTILDTPNSAGKPSLASTIKVYDTSGELLETEIEVINEDEASGNDKSDSQNLKANELQEYSEKHNGRYAYDHLSDSEKNTYCEIYAILQNMEEDVVLTSKDTDEIDHAFKCVMVDYPEIFYVKGYSIGKYIRKTKIDRITISGTYTMTPEQMAIKMAKVEEYITSVINKAPDGDDYEKIKFVYEYLVHNNVYDDKAPNNQNILSVVDNGRTVCQGYAKMTQLLLNRMGIFCTLVNGTAAGGSKNGSGDWTSHVWNIVKSDGKYYNVDTTWGDAAFTLVDENSQNGPSIEINYEFLLVADSDLKGTHKPNPVVGMPICNSNIDNYYVREGRLFYSLDEEQLQRVFDEAYEKGDIMVSIKATDNYVYDAIKEHLITDQKIFTYIVGDSVKYVEYPERNMMLITL